MNCPNHPDVRASLTCEGCGATICARCAFGGGQKTLCRPCSMEGVGRTEPGKLILKIVLFIVALPVVAPGLIFFFLGIKRWGRVPGSLFALNMLSGATLAYLFYTAVLGLSVEWAVGLTFLSFCASLFFFVVFLHKRWG